MRTKRKASLPVPVANSAVPAASLSQGGRFDLTYKRIADLNLSGKSFQLSLFTGAVLERCRFIDVNFNRCDFAGTKFVDCVFEHCSFDSIEIRSCFLKKCELRFCNLKRSEWALTQVEETQFDECKFNEASLRDATFSKSKFVRCKFPRCSVVLDRFKQCTFEDVDLSDSTALFLFFDECIFIRSRVATECVGYTYGLTSQNIEALELSYLGYHQVKPEGDDVVDFLLENYIQRHWYVGACALELNFGKLEPASALCLLTRRLAPEIMANKRVDWDELQFLSLVLQRLKVEGRLPLVGIWPLYRLVQGAYATLQEEFPASQSFISAPELVLKRLSELLNDTVSYVAEFLPDDSKRNDHALLEFCFKVRPEATILEVIPEAILSLFGSNRSEIKFLSGQSGSWIELWHLSESALAAVTVTLIAINGTMKQLLQTGKDARAIAKLFRTKKTATKRMAKTRRHSKTKKALDQTAPIQLMGSLVDQKVAAQERILQISNINLERLDRVVFIVLNLSDDQLRLFDDYSIEWLQAAKITKRRRSARRAAQ